MVERAMAPPESGRGADRLLDEAMRALVDARRRVGYTAVFDRDGWVLLQRPRH